MKLLLVGALNEALYSLNECLMEDFEIQMCSENARNVKDMIRLLRPSIIVFNILEMSDEIGVIFDSMASKLDAMPMVVIGTSQINVELEQKLEHFKKVKLLTRPIKTSDVKKACFEILNISEEISKESQNFEINNKKRILVIDDSALILRRIKQFLESEYVVSLANSGKKGLDILEQNKIDLVLLDYDMPDMDGREVFENIIGNEKTKDIPVVFLTSVAQRDSIMEVLKNRPFGYILKPPVQDKIRSVIGEALKE